MKLTRLFIAIIISAVAAVMTAATPSQSQSVWEETASAVSPSGDDSQAIEVVIRDHAVFVILQRPTVVEIFTILGQPVSRETLRGGTHRLKLRSRGIYILRAGSLTRRITI